jgi:general secretion pathway protein G
MKLRSPGLSRRARAGFSLAELMVVIVILGLIATIVVPNLLGRFFVAQREKAKMDITQLVSAVTTYTLENGGRYPDSLEILVTPDENGNTYLASRNTVPLDPWKNQYVYEPPSGGRPFRIISFGKDGQPGGEGEDADIDNVTMVNEGQDR